jgi:protein-disulfide isomerase
LRACIGDPNAMTTLSKSIYAHLDADNVDQTPTFFVNGKRMDGREKADFDTAIKAALKGQ